tara:strand:+ start:249 stop:476 length:228 start_codon:yes stop_codon:yes gene_type:complete
MAELTEQQRHLQSVIAQQQDLVNDINMLQAQIKSKKELFNKTQGVVEYLTQLGVKLPDPETPTVPVVETNTEVVE